jgi:hypothetical protein
MRPVMQQLGAQASPQLSPLSNSQAARRSGSAELRTLLLLLVVLESFGWSVLFDQPPVRCLENGLLAGVLFALLARLHRRWQLDPVISRLNWQLLFIVLLTLVSLVHWRWLNEDTSDFGTGISDAHYVLEVLRGTAADYVRGYVGGYALWLYPIVTLFGIDNFYAIALVNTALIALAALALGCVMRVLDMRWRAAPVVLFLCHPYSIVLAATIYKDPLIICGTMLVFAGISLDPKHRASTAPVYVRRPGLMLATGLIMAILGRPAFALVLILFIGALFFVQAVRRGRIGWRVLRLALGAGVVLVIAVAASSYFDTLPVILNSLRRIYDPTAGADLTVSTGGYTADQSSIGVRFLSGSLLQRIALLPMLIAMQLVSPFPPRLMPIENVYFWVEECFGLINLTIAPLLAVGLVTALRSRETVLKLVPPYAFFLVLPAVAFGGVIGRQLSPIVPFLLVLAWFGWRSIPSGPARLVAILAIPLSWALAFGAYGYLRSL